MEIVYCSRCGNMIPPGGIEEGKHVLVDNEPVCNVCAKGLPRAELERATPTQVPAAERKRPTTQLMAAARRPSSRRLPETVPEAESGPPRWFYSAACGVGLVLILTVAVAVAMRGGDEQLPPPGAGAAGSPREKPVTPVPEDAPKTNPVPVPVAGERVLPAEADAYFPPGKKYGRGTSKNLNVGPKGKSVAILRFDIAATRAPVGRAVLKLNYRYSYKEAYTGAAIGLAAVQDQNWDEKSTNGTTQLQIGPVRVRWTAATDSPPHFDVTAIVNEALAAGQKKVSFLLAMEKDRADQKSIAFGSRDCDGETRRPKLVITPGKQSLPTRR